MIVSLIIFLFLLVSGFYLIVLAKQRFAQTTGVLSDCICYNQSNMCICNATYSYKGDTFKSGITVPGNAKDGDKITIFIDTMNPYVLSNSIPFLEKVAYVLIGVGILQLIFSILMNKIHFI